MQMIRALSSLMIYLGSNLIIQDIRDSICSMSAVSTAAAEWHIEKMVFFFGDHTISSCQQQQTDGDRQYRYGRYDTLILN